MQFLVNYLAIVILLSFIKSTMSQPDKPAAPSIKFDEAELKKRLTELEFKVTQEKDTERPYTGKYWQFTDAGMYSCVVCKKPLFFSTDKFESSCGWPAFSDVISSGTVALHHDDTHGMSRTEATCAHCGAHLGHLFDDGPPPKRTRYCINSASLTFTPVAQLNAEQRDHLKNIGREEL